jgi:hypothetical protein
VRYDASRSIQRGGRADRLWDYESMRRWQICADEPACRPSKVVARLR